jgi:tetratricopeptide (TPR) repeat protein
MARHETPTARLLSTLLQRTLARSGAEGAPARLACPAVSADDLYRFAITMSWWSRLTGGKSASQLKPQRLDYLNEALALERQGDYDAALTSYRLALRDQPNDPRILQNMAIAFSRTGRMEEAVRCYRRALDLEPQLSGAHYGLAFLLLKRGELSSAESHLTAFLANPPRGEDAERWVRHAQQTLEQLHAPQKSGPGAGTE